MFHFDTIRAASAARGADPERNRGAALSQLERALELARRDGGANPSKANRLLQERLQARIADIEAAPSGVSWPLERPQSSSSADLTAIIDAYGSMGLRDASASNTSLPTLSTREAMERPRAARSGSYRETWVLGRPAATPSSASVDNASTPALSSRPTSTSDLTLVTPLFFRLGAEQSTSNSASDLGAMEFLIASPGAEGPTSPQVAYCALPAASQADACSDEERPRSVSPQLPGAPRLPSLERFDSLIDLPLPAAPRLPSVPRFDSVSLPRRLERPDVVVPRSPSPLSASSDDGLYITALAPLPRRTDRARRPLGWPAGAPSTMQRMPSQRSERSLSAESAVSDDEAAVVQRAVVQPLSTAQVRLVRLSAFVEQLAPADR